MERTSQKSPNSPPGEREGNTSVRNECTAGLRRKRRYSVGFRTLYETIPDTPDRMAFVRWLMDAADQAVVFNRLKGTLRKSRAGNRILPQMAKPAAVAPSATEAGGVGSFARVVANCPAPFAHGHAGCRAGTPGRVPWCGHSRVRMRRTRIHARGPSATSLPFVFMTRSSTLAMPQTGGRDGESRPHGAQSVRVPPRNTSEESR